MGPPASPPCSGASLLKATPPRPHFPISHSTFSSGACVTVVVTYDAAASVFPIHNRPLLLQELHKRILHFLSDSFNHPLQVTS